MKKLIIKKVKPLFNRIVTTAGVYEEDLKKGALIDASHMKGSLKDYQKVVSVGDAVRNIKVGDLVMINPKRYAKYKHQRGSLKDGVITDNPVISYSFPTLEMDGITYLMLFEDDIMYVISDYEEKEDKEESSIITPKEDLII